MLGHIGSPKAISVLEGVLADRRFQQTNANSLFPEKENGLWQVELAIAQVMASLGKPQMHLIEKHLADPRPAVRRHARLLRDQPNVAYPSHEENLPAALAD